MKSIMVRIRKSAPGRYLVEQRRRFLFWHFWQKGCPTLRLNKYYSSIPIAKDAIRSKSKKRNVSATIIIYR